MCKLVIRDADFLFVGKLRMFAIRHFVEVFDRDEGAGILSEDDLFQFS